MAKMTAMQAAVRVLESEGVRLAFGVPGAAILPLYEALKASAIRHVLVRHEEGGTHAAEGYTRARSGNIGVCIGTSGPAGTNMVTGLYSAIADSIPILCITGQAPRAKLHKEDFQAIDMLAAAERPLIVAGGGVINADAAALLVEFAELTNTPVVPTLMGWGAIPDDHPLNAGMVGLQTQHRYGNANFLDSDLVLGIGNRWANRHTGSTAVYTRGRKFVHIDIEPMQIGRVFCPDLGIVSDAGYALEALIAAAREAALDGGFRRFNPWVAKVAERKRTMKRRTDFDEMPIKPQRVFAEINAGFGRDTQFVTAIGLYQIASGQFQEVYAPRNYIVCGQAGPLGWEVSACTGAKLADPAKEVVGIVGDYSFQFLIEELAVAAQYQIPFVMILLNNAYLGLIRQAERAYQMDFEVQLAFANINAPEIGEYGVDHVKAAEAFGCRAIRVFEPGEIAGAIAWARRESATLRLPVIVEIITERVTNIAMGAEIDAIAEFEEVLDLPAAATLETV